MPASRKKLVRRSPRRLVKRSVRRSPRRSVKRSVRRSPRRSPRSGKKTSRRIKKAYRFDLTEIPTRPQFLAMNRENKEKAIEKMVKIADKMIKKIGKLNPSVQTILDDCNEYPDPVTIPQRRQIIDAHPTIFQDLRYMDQMMLLTSIMALCKPAYIDFMESGNLDKTYQHLKTLITDDLPAITETVIRILGTD